MEQKKATDNRKRGTFAGFGYGIFVAILITAGLLTINIGEAEAGCAGDCMTCHENLKGTPEHDPLESCIQCHEASKPTLLGIPASENGACGNDCFECHNYWPNTKEHEPLNVCQSCHLPGVKGKPLPYGQNKKR